MVYFRENTHNAMLNFLLPEVTDIPNISVYETLLIKKKNLGEKTFLNHLTN